MSLKIQTSIFKLLKDTNPDLISWDWSRYALPVDHLDAPTFGAAGIFICRPFQQQMKILKQ